MILQHYYVSQIINNVQTSIYKLLILAKVFTLAYKYVSKKNYSFDGFFCACLDNIIPALYIIILFIFYSTNRTVDKTNISYVLWSRFILKRLLYLDDTASVEYDLDF